MIARRVNHSKSWVLKWCSRYKALGVEGLFDKARSGCPPKLLRHKEKSFIERVQKGATTNDPVSVFKGRYIKEILQNEYGVSYSTSGVYDLLRRCKFTRIKPRPCHQKNDKTVMNQWVAEILPTKINEVQESHPQKKIELWFQDEMRFGEKTRIAYEWRLSGTSWEQTKQTGYRNCYIFGAVTPESGKHIGLVSPECNTEVMNLHLSLISQDIAPDKQVILIMDQAGWHSKSKDLKVPENISILDLPPYSPQLNPVERLWLHIKENYLANLFIEKEEDLTKIGCRIWNQLSDKIVKSICKTSFTNFS